MITWMVQTTPKMCPGCQVSLEEGTEPTGLWCVWMCLGRKRLDWVSPVAWVLG